PTERPRARDPGGREHPERRGALQLVEWQALGPNPAGRDDTRWKRRLDGLRVNRTERDLGHLQAVEGLTAQSRVRAEQRPALSVDRELELVGPRPEAEDDRRRALRAD